MIFSFGGEKFSKSRFYGDDEKDRATAQRVCLYVLETILKLMHPYCPFITEEIWQNLPMERSCSSIMIDTYPRFDPDLENSSATREMKVIMDTIDAIRSLRGEMNVPPSSRLPLTLSSKSELINNRVKKFEELLLSLGRLSAIKVSENIPPETVQVVIDEAVAALPVGDFINVQGERARLEKEMEKIDLEIGKITKKLKNPNFVSKAPPEVVEEQRRRSEEYVVSKQKLEEAYSRLSAL